MHKIAILGHRSISLFELGCAVELFGLPRPEIPDWYQAEVVSFDKGPLESTAGVQLMAKTVSSLQRYNTLVIPSWPTSPEPINPALQSALVRFHRAGGRIISFCSGAFLLAELGLLKHRQATTHWRYADTFKSRYPDVSYVDDVLYVYDGKLGCSAGSAAALDLGIEVIRRDFGYTVANQIARRLVLSAHRGGGQSQFAETPVLETPGHFAKSLQWAMSNLNNTIDVNMLAARAKMSRRTFDRKFRSSLNITPKQWLTRQRLARAKELLENNNETIERVAEQSGFDNAITLRHHFRQQLGVSPTQYRQQFSAATKRASL